MTLSFKRYRQGFDNEDPCYIEERKNIKLKKAGKDDYCVSFGQYMRDFTFKGLISHEGKSK